MPTYKKQVSECGENCMWFQKLPNSCICRYSYEISYQKYISGGRNAGKGVLFGKDEKELFKNCPLKEE